jgi:hypothetical protein
MISQTKRQVARVIPKLCMILTAVLAVQMYRITPTDMRPVIRPSKALSEYQHRVEVVNRYLQGGQLDLR